jgi:uncharacterized delta-60 repeat protein
MGLIKRTDKGNKLTISELDGNFEYLASLGVEDVSYNFITNELVVKNTISDNKIKLDSYNLDKSEEISQDVIIYKDEYFEEYEGLTNNIPLLNNNSEITTQLGKSYFIDGDLLTDSVDIGTGFNSITRTIQIQSDGKIIVGGDFSFYQGVAANRINRLNSDGTRDTSFDIGTGFNDTVLSTQIQSDGKILVGGQFTTYQGVSANRIIRLNSDGTRDITFDIGTGFGSTVQSIQIQSDGKILVGGQFTTYQGVSANRIIRLNSDGTRDTTFDIGTGFNSDAYEIKIQSDGKILVGGNFTTYQGVSVNRIIRLNSDGTRDNTFDIGTGLAGGFARTIGIQSDGKIIVGGDFTTYQGVSANRIIRLNSDGTRDTSFNIGTGFNSQVNNIKTQQDDKLIITGFYSTYQGVAAVRIIRLNSDGTRDNTFDIGTGFNNFTLFSEIAMNNKILIVGFFTQYQGVSANRIIRLNSDGTRDFESIEAITTESINFNSFLYFNKLYNPNATFDIGTGFNNTVWSIQLQSDGKIILGGAFTTYQGVSVNRIIRLNSDGTRDTSFDDGIGFNNTVFPTQIQSDGKILVGGQFTTYQGVSANRIIRLNSDGTRDNTFDIGTGFNDTVFSTQIQSDGKIIVGGDFTTYQGVSANRIIRLNSDGTRDTSFDIGTGFNNTVRSIQLQSDGKIIFGGSFTTYQGVSAVRIIRLNSDGTRDTSFDVGTGFDSTVQSIQTQSDGKILVGGQFTTYQGVSSNYIIRLNSDGTRDNTFDIGTGFNGFTRTIQIQSDGKIILGGDFTTYQGVSANRIIRLNSDGTRDTTFDIGFGFDNSVYSTQTQSDGKIVVGGVFLTYQDVSANRIIRLNSAGGSDIITSISNLKLINQNFNIFPSSNIYNGVRLNYNENDELCLSYLLPIKKQIISYRLTEVIGEK